MYDFCRKCGFQLPRETPDRCIECGIVAPAGQRRTRDNRCIHCGYDLRDVPALFNGVCPDIDGITQEQVSTPRCPGCGVRV